MSDHDNCSTCDCVLRHYEPWNCKMVSDRLLCNDCAYAEQIARIATLERELAEARAIIAKLPRTADGVPVVPGMKLYPSFAPDRYETAGPVHTRYGYDVLHSTRASAKKARAAADSARKGGA